MPRLRLIVKTSILLLAAYSIPFAMRDLRAADALPNIIIVYADDQGYQDLGCFGSPNIKTPNIDRLATEGMSVDLLPTIASLVDADLPPHAIDGLDVSQVLVDPEAASPHRTEGFFYYRNNEIEAVRLGQWKLRTIAKQGKKDSPPSQSTIELFDLNADIGEQTNLAESHPDIVEKLKALAADYDARLKSSSRPVWRAEE